MIGSSICLISAGFGNLVGLSTSISAPSSGGHLVAHAGRGGDQVDFELALQPLLHDLQVQQAQETAAESEAERHRILRLEAEGAVVQPQFFQRLAQAAVLVRFHRIQPGEHHRLHFLEAGQRLGRGILSAQ